MPTYDYRCTACDHAFEHFQSISSPLLKKCPQCGKAKLERLIGTGAGLLFKGSGFYITDYRSKDYHEAAKKDAGASAPSKSDAKGEKSDGAAKSPPAPPASPASPGSSGASSPSSSRPAKGPKKGKHS